MSNANSSYKKVDTGHFIPKAFVSCIQLKSRDCSCMQLTKAFGLKLYLPFVTATRVAQVNFSPHMEYVLYTVGSMKSTNKSHHLYMCIFSIVSVHVLLVHLHLAETHHPDSEKDGFVYAKSDKKGQLMLVKLLPEKAL